MHKLNLPACHLDIRQVEGRDFVFDVLRKKLIVLTPEEWVRQHFVHLLIHQYKYPRALIKLEGGLTYNKLKKRSDIVVFDRLGNTFLIVECKSVDVSISQKVFEQVNTYNSTIRARYIAVTNGLTHFCCFIDHEKKKIEFMKSLPQF